MKTDVPCEGAGGLNNVGITEHAPETVAKGVFGANRARVFEENQTRARRVRGGGLVCVNT